jgi:hypothetical protein
MQAYEFREPFTRAYPGPDEFNSHTAGTVYDISECNVGIHLGAQLMHSPEFIVLIEQLYKIFLTQNPKPASIFGASPNGGALCCR